MKCITQITHRGAKCREKWLNGIHSKKNSPKRSKIDGCTVNFADPVEPFSLANSRESPWIIRGSRNKEIGGNWRTKKFKLFTKCDLFFSKQVEHELLTCLKALKLKYERICVFSLKNEREFVFSLPNWLRQLAFLNSLCAGKKPLMAV